MYRRAFIEGLIKNKLCCSKFIQNRTPMQFILILKVLIVNLDRHVLLRSLNGSTVFERNIRTHLRIIEEVKTILKLSSKHIKLRT